MRRLAAGTLGDLVITERALQPEDEATRTRVSELLCGLEPTVGGQGIVELPAGPVADVLHVGVARGAGTRGPRRVRASIAFRAIFRSLTGVTATVAWTIVVGIAAGGAVAVATIQLGGTLAGWIFVLVVLPVGFALVARRRRWRPVPSDASRPRYARRGDGQPRMLDPAGAGPDPPAEPLLVARWTPNIVRAALAVDRRDGPLDLDRLVDMLARLRVPSRLPRTTRWSVDSGAHVLVDLSEDMMPFRQDVVGILRRVRDVVGRDRVTVLRFAGRPMTDIGPGRRNTWGPFVAPPTRQSVVVITNFGLSSPRLAHDDETIEREWITLAQTLERRGCPLVALVPNAVARVPTRLRQCMAVIEWDRGTTATAVLRAVGR